MKKILYVLGSFLLVGLIIYGVNQVCREKSKTGLRIGSQGGSSQEGAKTETYTKIYEVGSLPTRVDIPFGYNYKYRIGYAPLDMRSNSHPEWIEADKVAAHMEMGQMVTWMEWKVSDKYEVPSNAKVIYTFTKVF